MDYFILFQRFLIFPIFYYLKLRGLSSLKKGVGESVFLLLLEGKFIYPNFSEEEMF